MNNQKTTDNEANMDNTTETERGECVTDTNILTTDEVILAGTRRTRQLLEIVQGGFKIVEKKQGKEKEFLLRFEVFDNRSATLTKLEYRAFVDAVNRINLAIKNRYIELTPGVDSMRLLNVVKAMEALVPGIYAGNLKNPALLAVVAGQWFPPGITIDLTPAETTALIAAIGLGAAGAGAVAALFPGVALPAGVVAALLGLDAAALTLLQALSTTGAIGLKITFIPPLIPIIIPYPI